MNERLGICPTCYRHLGVHDRAQMGLRNGEVLNELLPGRIGPSDIDHIIHNGSANPERFLILEYKSGNGGVPRGQERLLDSLKGSWTSARGRRIAIDYAVLPLQPESADAVLRPLVNRLFAPIGVAA